MRHRNVSKRSVESQYVKDEATYALKQDKLIPVTIENVNLPFRFIGVHTLSLLGWDGSKDFSEFRRLVDDISAILATNPAAAASAKKQRRLEAQQRRKVNEELFREQERQRSEENAKRKPKRRSAGAKKGISHGVRSKLGPVMFSYLSRT